MELIVKKRDGREVPFNKQKIINAVLKAFKAVEGEITEYAEAKAENIATYVENEAIKRNKILSIEEIQDMVEHGLMSTKSKDVARAYIEYRHDRDITREQKTDWMKLVREKIAATNTQQQNANVDEYSFGGRKGEANSVLMKRIALDYIMSDLARSKHLNNEIYTHDLDSYAVGNHNCLTVPFDELLANGFNTRQMDIRPAHSIGSAFQLVAVIFQLQSLQQFGGVSASHIDWTMVPYVRKSFRKHFTDGMRYIEQLNFDSVGEKSKAEDISIEDDRYKEWSKAYTYALNMTQKEVNQAVEGMYHNLNTLQSRSGN